MPPWPYRATRLRSTGQALVRAAMQAPPRRGRRIGGPASAPGSPARLLTAVRSASVDARGMSGHGSATAAPPIPGAISTTAGRIEIITGPMFAGKSTELLRRVAAHEAAGRTVLVFASAKDTRYTAGGGAVVTHTGISRPTLAAGPTLAAAAAAAGGHSALAAADVLAIDEAQFFPDLVSFATGAADAGGKTVLVAGLDGDFRRRPFGGVGALLPHADAITKLASTCAVCGAAAHFSVRLDAGDGDAPTPPGSPLRPGAALEGPQVVVGGADKYAAVCRAHYNSATGGKGVDRGGVAASVWAAVAAEPAPQAV